MSSNFRLYVTVINRAERPIIGTWCTDGLPRHKQQQNGTTVIAQNPMSDITVIDQYKHEEAPLKRTSKRRLDVTVSPHMQQTSDNVDNYWSRNEKTSRLCRS